MNFLWRMLVALLAMPVALLAGPEKGWTLGGRVLPAPAAASEAVHRSLDESPTPDVAAARAFNPQTKQDWQKILKDTAHTDDILAELGNSLAAQRNVRVEELRMGGVPVFRLTPHAIAPEQRGNLFLHIHGGAWFKGAGRAAIPEAVVIADELNMVVISVDYRMPPDFPHPTPLNDVVAVWRSVVKDHAPSRVAMGGSSAGGNMALAAVLKMKDDKLPLPGALMVGTPAVDLTKTGDSRFINEGVDRGLITWDGMPKSAARLYADKTDPTDKYLSPINGDFSGFPPTYLVTGTRDLLLSDTIRAHRKLRRAGVEAELHVYEGLAHAEYLKPEFPESREHLGELRRFVLKHLGD